MLYKTARSVRTRVKDGTLPLSFIKGVRSDWPQTVLCSGLLERLDRAQDNLNWISKGKKVDMLTGNFPYLNRIYPIEGWWIFFCVKESWHIGAIPDWSSVRDILFLCRMIKSGLIQGGKWLVSPKFGIFHFRLLEVKMFTSAWRHDMVTL